MWYTQLQISIICFLVFFIVFFFMLSVFSLEGFGLVPPPLYLFPPQYFIRIKEIKLKKNQKHYILTQGLVFIFYLYAHQLINFVHSNIYFFNYKILVLLLSVLNKSKEP